jgi:hypothetical protein
MYFDTSSAGETHIDQADFTGKGYTTSITVNAANSILFFNDCVFAQPIQLTSGKLAHFTNNELGAAVTVNAGFGIFQFLGNTSLANNSTIAINIGAAVSEFMISNNYLGGGTVTVATGASDHYIIANNLRTVVVDNGTGVNKSITGNIN